MENWIEKINSSSTFEELENIRIDIFGKKGFLTLEFARMKEIPNEEKKEFAQNLNLQKESLTTKLDEKKEFLNKEFLNQRLESEKIDVTKFNNTISSGATHPVAETMNKIINYFQNLNFAVEEGPLVEDDFHNFQALNLPQYHPARDMADTFYNKDYTLLRTHTSPVQIRTMLTQKAPIRMIAPGTVFRRDFDITHTPMFHQIEGLVVDKADKVSFANLKHLLVEFLQHMFGDVEVRFRPSFFPFTEPSAEVDISCVFCKGEGCRVCSQTGWLEVLGCGVVDQNVFNAVGYEDKSGYAFGLGVERFAMLIHSIGDLRSLFESDIRLLGQFK
ncbi:Phenylalanine--tRNA ligase alpha subunit [Aliarcobacter thereius]|uniref:Phenylalanine--tRNA ligase alpha subunit n=2 Tax=Aliarcobacter thereius TaxID=544718 RepID=A0A1C0B9D5_9BACT|nr:phenylalanine--tRNA ligase subunit alpha [Aliarcobacter thereius]OCL88652.1 Phenylalanine--tRNA ligase alpha subunit [Aliarcobacter thereius]OCL92147.1 Phenylalanine--tRNA ligase alpha subunit [Aliarcobacter thereius]OCL94757.1 Phenylalanine--tRNA ligase alpha subunit [Aliarcobacter thereius LMG 24486]OCM00205.1 Phenylalanine--tRNA ligase alpha subunit [Aliarcobacter thereius]QBF15367.1 phenylalanyl-tRNA synthetase, alpha subunit [Aliarcobacter thereius LMG 24486]